MRKAGTAINFNWTYSTKLTTGNQGAVNKLRSTKRGGRGGFALELFQGIMASSTVL